MRPHLRYLRYVLLHKWYVARAGVVINGLSPRWLWRLLVHDLSKFGRAEWQPYVDSFYALRAEAWCAANPKKFWGEEEQRRKAAFDRAWLHHQHANNHHWQHWLLREDSGKTIVLLMPAVVADEMVADWLGAGQKILVRPTMRKCVLETIAWYAKNRTLMVMREPTRHRVEVILLALADRYGLAAAAQQVREAAMARASLTVG